jgi:hypothetical protein
VARGDAVTEPPNLLYGVMSVTADGDPWSSKAADAAKREITDLHKRTVLVVTYWTREQALEIAAELTADPTFDGPYRAFELREVQ